MGYDVRITRKARWHEESGPTISEQEWRDLVASRADLQWWQNDDSRADRGVSVLNVDGDESAVLWWEPREGVIRTKNPQASLLSRMAEIADDVRAVAMGEEGETYHLPDRINMPIPFYDDPDNVANEWRMPSSEMIAELDRQRAQMFASLDSQAAKSSKETLGARHAWKIVGAILLVSWFLWKAFGTSTQ